MARMEIWSSEYYDREIEFSYSRLRACLWCKIHISWQMGCGQVPELLQCRTYEPAGNTTDLSHSKENFECIHEPLLNIPLTHVIDPWWTTFIAKSNQQTTAKYDWWTVQQRYAIEDFNWGVNQRKDISQGRESTSGVQKHHQPGAPNDGFLLNTLKTLFTFRCLEMYSKQRYKICICSAFLGELESFRSKLQGLVMSIQYFPENFRCNLK